MRIVIDLQGAQTASRFRGIGRYSTALSKAMARNAGNHEIWIVLNGQFPETIESIRVEFDGLIPQERIRVFELPSAIAELAPANIARARVAELVREAFIASLDPDVVYITSLFEGVIDDASSSVGRFSRSIPTAVTLYDLIPLLREKTAFANAQHKDWYFRKLQSLKQADLLLAISESARSEGISALQLEAHKAVNVSTAIDDIFRKIEIQEDERQDILERFQIPGPFVLYTGGCDERKNLDRLILAYANISEGLRRKFVLVLAGKMSSAGNDSEIVKLRKVAREAGINDEALVFTGYVSDEDLVKLYNLCSLFVFPSLHEGFGLPPLEAMACGAVTIGSNRTSIPEVIGRADALFDPENTAAMTQAIERALTEQSFRDAMKRHGPEQAKRFSWDMCAQTALSALEKLYETTLTRSSQRSDCRPRLAYVSPLPPERSGIADYSAELLPELARYYDIDVISDVAESSDAWIKANFPIRKINWFAANANRYDRILYQIGNSPFHAHMFELLQHFPGAVTLHDFFLSSVKLWMSACGGIPVAWKRSLHEMPQGYTAIRYLHQHGENSAKMAYPCNADVLHNSHGVIVHSPHNVDLVRHWFGEKAANELEVIPLLRKLPIVKPSRRAARQRLGIPESDFLVCSFGLLDPAKLNHRLLEAWSKVVSEAGNSARLVFVGANHGGDYGKDLERSIKAHFDKDKVRITGHVAVSVYEDFLAAADVAVQLRTHSRGETSKAILDCLANGLPTIINSHGTLSDYPEGVVIKLQDNFDDSTLEAALLQLRNNAELREQLSMQSINFVRAKHNPALVGALYYQAIESMYSRTDGALRSALVEKISKLEAEISDRDVVGISECIAANLPGKRQPELLLDVSATARNDLKTGIERVVRALTLEMISNPPPGYRVEPIYLCESGNGWQYRYARKYTSKLLGIPDSALQESEVSPVEGDVYIGLDLFPGVVEAEKQGLYQQWRNRGVSLNFVVYDLLPVSHPDFFPPGADEGHIAWLNAISRFTDGLMAISRSVADELDGWLKKRNLIRRPLDIGYFHLGADIISSAPTKGGSPDTKKLIATMESAPTFLMVGTIEPRKGHLQVIAAFEELWARGISVNLVIVGKEGWIGLPDSHRRTIPLIINKLKMHPELGKQLFWLTGISDEFLEKIYAASTCLIAASEGEGFGLPLIEAAQHGLPVIARDIPVFREVAGESAHYFGGKDVDLLAASIQSWMEQFTKGSVRKSAGIKFMNWRESASQLMMSIYDKKWYRHHSFLQTEGVAAVNDGAAKQ